MIAGTHAPRRLDIEGLRAVAIILVLLYHAGLPVTGGFIGVDVFFVISGFLITGLLLRELETTGGVSLPRFYARRAKRLLPAAGVVLVATAVLTWATATAVNWRTFGWDVVGAATYVVNWVLAGRSVDYLAEDVGASPVQHFWSLAIEEQFYLLWPAVLLFVTWRARKSGGGLRAWALGGVLALALPSFAWSVVYTAADPGPAFFATTTRLWELALGAVVAIGARAWPALPRVPAEISGWVGAGLIVGGAVGIDASTPWPSAWALVPTTGTALLIIAGYHRTTWSRWLSVRPAVWIGALSYSLYLWHWPVVEAGRSALGGLSPAAGVALSAASVLPAYLSYRLVENPIRSAPSLSSSNRLALSVGLNFSLAGAAAGLLLVAATLTTPAPAPPVADPPGAEAVDPGGVQEPEEEPELPPNKPAEEPTGEPEGFTPLPVDAPEDLPAAYAQGCQVDQSSPEPHLCEYGDLHGATRVAVVGDSKVIQYQSALDAIGKEHGIHFYSYTKSACVLSAGMQENKIGRAHV